MIHAHENIIMKPVILYILQNLKTDFNDLALAFVGCWNMVFIPQRTHWGIHWAATPGETGTHSTGNIL